MSTGNGSRVLIGRKSIEQYLGIGYGAFETLIREGLPAAVIGGRWYAHCDNLDQFFKVRTARGPGEVLQDAE